MTQLNLLWIIPLQFVVALSLVINLLGVAGFVGLFREDVAPAHAQVFASRSSAQVFASRSSAPSPVAPPWRETKLSKCAPNMPLGCR